jgi:hypothetical protein
MENTNPIGKSQQPLKDTRKTSLSQFQAAKKALASKGILTTTPSPQELALSRLKKPIETKQHGISRRRTRRIKHKNKKTTRK